MQALGMTDGFFTVLLMGGCKAVRFLLDSKNCLLLIEIQVGYMDRYIESLVLSVINSRKDIVEDNTLNYDDIKVLSSSIDYVGGVMLGWHGLVKISMYKNVVFDIYRLHDGNTLIICQKYTEPNYDLCETCIDDI